MLAILTYPQVNWNGLNTIAQEILGDHATRSLDDCGLKLNDPASLLRCLKFDSVPLAALRDPGATLDHLFISVVVGIDKNLLQYFPGNVSLAIIRKDGDDETLLVMSGTMRQWLDHCKNPVKQLKKTFDDIATLLKSTSLRELFQ